MSYTAAALRGRVTGGLERQVALLARHMAARGHQVSFVVVGDEGDDERIDGVLVRSAWRRKGGPWGIRYLARQAPALSRLLRELDAELYYSRGGSVYTPVIVRAARKAGAGSALGLAHDADVGERPRAALFDMGGRWLTAAFAPLAYRLLYVRSLRRCDWVIAQTPEQAARCERLGLRCRVIPNIVEPAPNELLQAVPTRDCVWVKNITADPQRIVALSNLIELARSMPEVSFLVLGSSAAEAATQLAGLGNVEVRGPVSYERTLEAIASARLVVNTSAAEGFSNVMLEGWSLGRPTVALIVDPGKLLADRGLGFCADGSMSAMRDAIRRYLCDDKLRAEAGARGMRYVELAHGPDTVCQAYEKLL